jgi:chorismate mutase
MTKYRKQIDKINNKILKLLSKRMKVSEKIGECKKVRNAPIRDEKREKELLNMISKQAKKHKLDEKFIEDVFQIILSESRRKQEK